MYKRFNKHPHETSTADKFVSYSTKYLLLTVALLYVALNDVKGDQRKIALFSLNDGDQNTRRNSYNKL